MGGGDCKRRSVARTSPAHLHPGHRREPEPQRLAHDGRHRGACLGSRTEVARADVGPARPAARSRRWKWVKVWRTSAPRSRQSAASGGRGGGTPSTQSLLGRPIMPPSRPGGRPGLDQDGAVARAPPGRRCRAGSAWRASPACAAARRRCPARRPAQAPTSGQTPQAGARRGADGRAEVHHRLGVVAGPRRRRQRGSQRPQRRLRRRQRRLDRKEPRHHPLDVAVDHHRRPVEGDRGHGGRRVGADAGQRPQRRPRCRGTGRRGRAPPPGRRRAGCGRGRSSRGRPRPPSPRHRARRRGRRPSASGR